MAVFEKVTKEDVATLLKKGYTLETVKTIHEDLRLSKDGVRLVLYKSGKLLIQGKDITNIVEDVEKWGIGEKVRKESFRKETGWMIGSDETLKGDTFGGIVVAGVRADDDGRKKLLELGVADSKALADKEILVMADKIRDVVSCQIRSMVPEEYNKKEGNVTVLLNKLHQEVGNYLKPGTHVVDQYPGCAVGDIQETKAESKYIEVAAASILARAAGLQQLEELSVAAGFTIPKGSTHVKLALHELEERKLDFRKFVKVDFNNVREFTK